MGSISALNSMTCNNCGKKLAEVKLRDGLISIRCSKCGTVNVQETKPTTPSVNKNTSS